MKQKILNLCLVVLLIFNLLLLVLGVGGGGVLNDLDEVLKVVRELENKNLLHNTPETIPLHIKSEIKLWENSAQLEEYFNHTNELVLKVKIIWYCMMGLFLVLILVKIILKLRSPTKPY